LNQDSNTIETSSGSGGLEMFRNRLKKNKKEISKWARKNNISCYRIYDKDVPQVPVAIDDYEGDFVLQYFRGPYDESDIIMDSRIRSIEDIILEVFEIKPNKLFTKLREKKKGSSQYNKLSKSYTTKIVTEGFAKFKKMKSEWNFSIYNLYARKNAYSIFFTKTSQAYKLAILSFVPSISYNFIF